MPYCLSSKTLRWWKTEHWLIEEGAVLRAAAQLLIIIRKQCPNYPG
jgi:hypothetical protein